MRRAKNIWGWIRLLPARTKNLWAFLHTATGRIRAGWVVSLVALIVLIFASSGNEETAPAPDRNLTFTGVLSDLRADQIDSAVLIESAGTLTVFYRPEATPVDLADQPEYLRELQTDAESAGLDLADPNIGLVTTIEVPYAYAYPLIKDFDTAGIPLTVSHSALGGQPLTGSGYAQGQAQYGSAEDAAFNPAMPPDELDDLTEQQRAALEGDDLGQDSEQSTDEDGALSADPAAVPAIGSPDTLERRLDDTGDPAGTDPVVVARGDASPPQENGTYPSGGPTMQPVVDEGRGWSALIQIGALVLLVAGSVVTFSGYRARGREAAAARSSEPAPTLPGARPSPGKKRAAATEEFSEAKVPDTRFADVAGCDEAIAELTEMVIFLKEPERFTRTGAKAPKGAMLAGPPGTGKTLLARAVAGEAGVPFFSVAGSDFVEMYVGVGAKRVRALFAAARAHERAIIFIDEIDAVARRRGSGDTGGNAEVENTLNALLTEMDGFEASSIIVLAATNRADMLDPAITRPGRLDRKVEVPNPDRRGREKILAVHTAGKPIADDVDFVALARRTPGFSGAQLASLVNEACLEAVRHDLDEVTQECFDAAVATIAMGRARTSALVTDHDREVTAWHEAGHTVAAFLQADADDPVQVTIVPRGPAGGVTWMSGSDDIFLPKRKAHAQLVTALSGRAGEELLLDGQYTSGASGDLSSATQLATAMATQYGMTRLGYQVRSSQSDAAAHEVVEELLSAAHKAATELLQAHASLVEAVSLALLDVETLTLADVEELARSCGIDRSDNAIVLDLEDPRFALAHPVSKERRVVDAPLAEATGGPHSGGVRIDTALQATRSESSSLDTEAHTAVREHQTVSRASNVTLVREIVTRSWRTARRRSRR